MSTAVAAALKKIAAFILSDKELRGKTFVIIGSIIAGFLGLMCLPAVVLLSLGNMEFEPPEIDKSLFNEAAFIENLSDEQQAQLVNLQNQGQAIENAMVNADCKNQTIKAQLIYLSFFEGVQNFNVDSYANIFKNSPDDKAIIDTLNSTYGLKIDYSEFMKSYTWVMNATINGYMFADSKNKNAADLAAWAENAYISGWGYKDGAFGDRDESDRIRYTDCAGLILGYLRYDPEQKMFNSEPSSFHFTSKGSLDKMPDEVGIILSDGTDFGVYVGGGEVIFASEELGYVTKEKVADGTWNSWSSISGAAYNTDISFDEYDEKKKNNLGLVQWAIQAHEAGWGYIYGTYGNVLTENLLQDRAAVFGSEVTDYMDFIRQNWLGKRTADCVGLIKGYGWYDAESGEIKVGSNGMMDVGANAMFANATVKGTIDTIPEVPGLAVWVDGHIGIYIGNGEVIEAMNTLRGVTRTQLAGREWTHWLQIPYISYVENMEEDK